MPIGKKKIFPSIAMPWRNLVLIITLNKINVVLCGPGNLFDNFDCCLTPKCPGDQKCPHYLRVQFKVL